MLRILVVLGKNWQKLPQSGDSKIELSQDSKISALAAGALFLANECDFVIFSAGKTAGQNWPSEAQAMKDYMLYHMFEAFPLDFYKQKIILEKESIDLFGSAEEVGKILHERGWRNQEIDLMSVGYHLPRARKIFSHWPRVAFTYSLDSYEVLIEQSGVYREMARNRQKSFGVKLEKIKEFILRAILLVDRDGRLLRQK